VNESWLYGNTDTELYKTSAISGSDATVTNTEVFTSAVALNIETGAVVDVSFKGSGATDDFTLKLYKKRSDSFESFDQAIWSSTISNAGATINFQFTIDDSYGAGFFRFGMASTAGNDTFDVDAEMRTYRLTENILSSV